MIVSEVGSSETRVLRLTGDYGAWGQREVQNEVNVL